MIFTPERVEIDAVRVSRSTSISTFGDGQFSEGESERDRIDHRVIRQPKASLERAYHRRSAIVRLLPRFRADQ